MKANPTSPVAEATPVNQLRAFIKAVHVMKVYAAQEGLVISQEVAKKIACLGNVEESLAQSDGPKPPKLQDSLSLAIEVHGHLSRLVAPATPESIEYTQPFANLRDLRKRQTLIYALLLVAIFSVAGFLASLVLSKRYPQGAGIIGAIVDQLQMVFAAMVGAGFYTLYTAHRYIVNRTFDRAYSMQYVVRFVLGVVAGVVLANLAPVILDRVDGSEGEENLVRTLTVTLFALIGGYSADAVNAVLTRVGETITTLISGPPSGDHIRREAEAAAIESKAAAQAEVSSAKNQELLRLQELLTQAHAGNAASVAEAIKRQIERLIDPEKG
jgi:hypothetical protein